MERENDRRAEALDRYWDAVIASGSPGRPTEVDDVAASVIAQLGEQDPPAESAVRERTRQRILSRTMQMEASMIPHPQLTSAVPQRTPAEFLRPRWSRSPWTISQVLAVALVLLGLVTSLVGSRMWRSRDPGIPLSHLAAPTSQPAWAASPTAVPQSPPTLAEFVAEITPGSNPMTSLEGIAASDDGTLYVIDAFRDQVLRFGRDGQLTGAWGATGTGPGEFRFHEGGAGFGDLAIGPDGNLYVADPFNNRIQVLSPDGNVVRTWGEAGSADGQFAEPGGITLDNTGRVYVADSDNARVQVFDADGQFLSSWVPSSGEDGPRPSPSDVNVDPAGIISVTDERTRQVIRLDAAGTVVGVFGGESNEPDAMVLPSGLTSDAQGNLFVADANGNRVQVFAPDGSVLGTIGGVGVDPGKFITPVDVALGPGGLLYVSDNGNRRIQVFRLLPPLSP